MEAREPQRLVDVDVPEPRHRPLVEERRLYGRLAVFQPPGEEAGGKAPLERLGTDLDREVRLELPRLEQEPRAEAPDIPIADVRSIV